MFISSFARKYSLSPPPLPRSHTHPPVHTHTHNTHARAHIHTHTHTERARTASLGRGLVVGPKRVSFFVGLSGPRRLCPGLSPGENGKLIIPSPPPPPPPPSLLPIPPPSFFLSFLSWLASEPLLAAGAESRAEGEVGGVGASRICTVSVAGVVCDWVWGSDSEFSVRHSVPMSLSERERERRGGGGSRI